MKLLNNQGKEVNGKMMISFVGVTFSMGCKIRFLISYQYHESAKELQETLKNKYMAKDANSKKFLASNFNSYKMVENRLVIDQFRELQRMHANMKLHKIEMDEVFIFSSIIDKLPPS